MNSLTIVDNFSILSLIGKGGMAYVFLAVDPNTKHKVALKIMDPEATDDKIRRIRFNAESKAIYKFQHPNIIQIIKPTKKVKINLHGKNYLTLYYVMKYFPGQSLKHFLSRKDLSINETIDVFIQILDALNYCHLRKIFHRDLKPANILVKKKEGKLIPVITDFGIAKFKGDELSKGIELTTAAIKALGAPAYMSPEQIYDARKVSPQSDLYSVGIMLYEALTGERPFKGTYSELIQQQLNKPPVDPQKLNPKIDNKLNKLVLNLLAKEPSQRPSSAEEVIQRLKRDHVGTTTIQMVNNSISTRNTKSNIYTRNEISLLIYSVDNRNEVFNNFPVFIGKGKESRNNFFPIITNSKKIVTKHCVVFPKNDKFFLKNLSSIGIKVNGELLKDKKEILLNTKYSLLFPDNSKLAILIKKEKINNIVPLLIISIIIIIILFAIILIS